MTSIPRNKYIASALYVWRLFLARFRLSESAVCEMSAGMGLFNDFHDYIDDEVGIPNHFVRMRCKRCGKEFYI